MSEQLVEETIEVSDEVVDEAISAALSGYANTQEGWVKAKAAFYDYLTSKQLPPKYEHNRLIYALREALSTASEGAECNEMEAQSRFWNKYEGLEDVSDTEEIMNGYADEISGLTLSVESFLTVDQEHNSVLYEKDGSVRVESRMPYGGRGPYISIERKQTDTNVVYGLIDSTRGPIDGQVDRYLWSEGDAQITFETVGPILRSMQLSKDDFSTLVNRWDAIIETDAELVEEENARKKPIKNFGKRVLNRLRS